jgi:hypothetical protein
MLGFLKPISGILMNGACKKLNYLFFSISNCISNFSGKFKCDII